MSWSASTSPARSALQELVSFLIEKSGQFMEAEEGIEGRSPDVTSPSSHNRGNLLAEADNDHARAVSLLAIRLQALAEDVRDRAETLRDAAEATMLTELADGLVARAGRLAAF